MVCIEIVIQFGAHHLGFQLLRLNICDAKTGICIFEKIWSWSGTSVSEGICKLVLTFHKISKEIGDNGGRYSAFLARHLESTSSANKQDIGM